MAKSTAVLRASSESTEPSVASRILVGKMLISASVLPWSLAHIISSNQRLALLGCGCSYIPVGPGLGASWMDFSSTEFWEVPRLLPLCSAALTALAHIHVPQTGVCCDRCTKESRSTERRPL